MCDEMIQCNVLGGPRFSVWGAIPTGFLLGLAGFIRAALSLSPWSKLWTHIAMMLLVLLPLNILPWLKEVPRGAKCTACKYSSFSTGIDKPVHVS